SSINARYEDWMHLSDEEYKERKEYLAQNALDTMEKLVAGFKDKVEHVNVSSPRTVEKYTHHHFGSSFGTKFEGLAVSKELPNEIKGLFHAGSVGIIMSGWLGAANYGVIVGHDLNTYLDKSSEN
ncbi:phytoene dehydrogenase, partial [Halobacteriovorax sp. ZH3_bin.1]